MAHATGGALVPAPGGAPTTLDVQIATTKVAGSPASSTRWSRITVGGVTKLLWLVPARPGAAVDYANDAWLDALDETTAPRVLPRMKPIDCNVKEDVERVETWGSLGPKRYPKSVTVLVTEAEARAHASALEVRVDGDVGARLHDAYTRGWAFVALEIETPGAGLSSSPTVRVRDDGGLLPGGADGLVPLALTGSAATASRVTAWVLGDGGSELPGTREIAENAIVWSEKGSTFARERATQLTTGSAWIRESATHDLFWSELPLPKAKPLPPLHAAYFTAAAGGARAGCETSALAASNAIGVVRRTCGAGAVANVPGGAPCVPGSGVDPSAFTCGPGVDDLAHALAGVSPTRITATRFSGTIVKGSFGADLPFGPSSVVSSPLYDASRTECEGSSKGTSSSSSSSSSSGSGGPAQPGSPSSGGAGATSSTGGPSYFRRTESCNGSSVVFVDSSGHERVVSDDEGCGGSTETASTGGSTSSTSSSSSGGSSSGWDTDDSVPSGSSTSSSSSSSDGCGGESGRTSSSDDGCGGDSTSSSSDDSCGCGSGSSSSSDGCGSGSSSSSDGCDSGSGSGGDSCSGGGSDSCSCAKGAGATNGAGGGERLFPKAQVARGQASRGTSGRSPVSRYALFFVALALPLRRRLRNTTWKW
ncbi:MAG: hypothetical protein JST00_27110 [Deltaproteobacteria bacterium]|nr:hypothetical protein [Deltaproteobacteria bacterium]